MFSAVPTRWLSLAFLFLVAGLALGNLVLLAAAVFLLVYVLMGAGLSAPCSVSIQRTMPRVVCWAGDGLEIQRHVEIGSGVGLVFVHDQLPTEMEVVTGNNFRLVWKWPGVKSYDLSYRIICPTRGVFTLANTTWDSEAPMGLPLLNHGTAGAAIEVSVVPRTQAIRRVNEVRGRAHDRVPMEDVAVTGVSTTDFTELRPYTLGDPIRAINWKASARSSGSSNPLLVNRYEPEGRKAVWIFLDGADYMDVGPVLSSLIDHAVEAAGSIAQYYLSRGYTLGAYVYNSPGDILTPEMGQKQFRRLTNMLTNVKPGPPKQDLLQAVEWCKSFLFRLQPEVFTITRLDVNYPGRGENGPSLDGFHAGIKRLVSLRPHSRRLNRVRVVHLEPKGYHRAMSPLEIQAQGLMQWEVQPIYASLRRAGALVLPWDPAQENFTTALIRNLNIQR